MLPRKHRIDKKTFTHIFDTGKRFFSDYFTLIVLPTPSKKQFAFVVSKKVEKGAFKRNRLKRKTRGVFEEVFDEVTVGYSGIFLVKKEIKGVQRDDIKDDLIKVLKKAGIIKSM